MRNSLALEIENALKAVASPGKDLDLARFFKTGKGEYGEGDRFLGVYVPEQRKVAARFAEKTSLEDLKNLLASDWHECRVTALLILTLQFSKANQEQKKRIVEFYEASFERINNWDLVDLSAEKILGPWYESRDRKPLMLWAKSSHLWTQRIAVLTTFHFIRKGNFETTFQLAEVLLDHKHDLIHKAVGWMLREIGNRDQAAEEGFLRAHYKQMPRTMLRYAIEKFPKDLYQAYLTGSVK